MPRAKSKSTVPPVPKKERLPYACPDEAPWGGFLNLRISELQRADFDVWLAEHAKQINTLLDDYIMAGVKVSLALDADNECYVVTFTGRLCASIDDRCAASARAGTLNETIALMLYKHHVLANGYWDDFRPKSGTFMKWG